MYPQRLLTRETAVVFVLGIVGTLVPVIGWLVGVALILRASAWSRREKAVAVLAPLAVLMAAVALRLVAHHRAAEAKARR